MYSVNFKTSLFAFSIGCFQLIVTAIFFPSNLRVSQKINRVKQFCIQHGVIFFSAKGLKKKKRGENERKIQCDKRRVDRFR